MENTSFSPIPSKEFDREYSTQWRKEMEFLREKGIEYTFAKRVGEYKIPTYKYRKTPKLFLALAEFYNQQQFRKNMDAIDETTKKIEDSLSGTPLEKGYIEIEPDNAEKKLFEDNKNTEIKEELIEKLNHLSSAEVEEIKKAMQKLNEKQDDTI